MKFTAYNHKAPADHVLQNAEFDTEASPDHLARIVLAATGGGMSEQATAKAMEANSALRDLAVGGGLRLQAKYLDLAMNSRDIDITLTRVEG